MDKRSVVRHHEEDSMLGPPLEMLKAQQHRKGSDKSRAGKEGGREEAPFLFPRVIFRRAGATIPV